MTGQEYINENLQRLKEADPEIESIGYKPEEFKGGYRYSGAFVLLKLNDGRAIVAAVNVDPTKADVDYAILAAVSLHKRECFPDEAFYVEGKDEIGYYEDLIRRAQRA